TTQIEQDLQDRWRCRVMDEVLVDEECQIRESCQPPILQYLQIDIDWIIHATTPGTIHSNLPVIRQRFNYVDIFKFKFAKVKVFQCSATQIIEHPDINGIATPITDIPYPDGL